MLNADFLVETLKSRLYADIMRADDFRPEIRYSVSTDSRETGSASIFIALRGENHDANDFVFDCHSKGCRVFVMDRARASTSCAKLPGSLVIGVDDTGAALTTIASAYREILTGSIIAITGSSGKTTTRELIARVLETRFRVHTPRKNLNNEIGLPLTLLEAPEESHLLVLELGMNHSGEISRLTRVARPDAVLITNIGWAHVGNFSSRDGIACAKAEIFEGLTPNAVAFLCRDDEYYGFLAERCPVRFLDYGKTDLEILEDRGTEGYLLRWKGFDFLFPAPGEHNLTNLAGAFRVGEYFGVEAGTATRAAREFRAVGGRNEILSGKFTLINDCYNANPSSMKAGLETLGKAGGRKVAILGDMRELGDLSESLHSEIGKWIGEKRLADIVLLNGDFSRHIAAALSESGIAVRHHTAKQDLIRDAQKTVQPGDTVLVKASRGMKLEEVVEALRSLL
jgi:UDP-N-acetylmuramoyl-tripeptide--D-alanyl-D-alanine ligase